MPCIWAFLLSHRFDFLRLHQKKECYSVFIFLSAGGLSMADQMFHFEVKVYYDATDLNGHVNYASYMNYFSRAREEMIGFGTMANMVNKDHAGIAVYNATMQFRGAAKYGDTIDIRSSFKLDGEFKAIVHQEAWVHGQPKPAVTADFDLVCIDTETHKLLKIPVFS